jgi:apolipoprotein D and lipocalin family protein
MRKLFLAPAVLALHCTSQQPMPTVSKVDLARYMGKWYVIATIPTFIETGAFNATEEYTLTPEGEIDTIFTFRKGAFDGPEKKYNPRGFVVNKDTNAEWKMQFLWPFKSEFLISYLSADYAHTVVARTKRDYVWIMARSPQMPEVEYQKLVAFLVQNGYDTTKLRRVPQQSPTADLLR